jgi:hypothetical protein
MSTFDILAMRGIFGFEMIIFTFRPVLLSMNVLKETFLWEETFPPAVYVLEDEDFVEEEEEDELADVDPPEEIVDPEESSLVLPVLLDDVSSSPVKSSGGGPVSTKPSSPGTVPGRL